MSKNIQEDIHDKKINYFSSNSNYGGASPTNYQVMTQIGISIKTYSGTIYTDGNITIDTFTIGNTASAASLSRATSLAPVNRDIGFNNLPTKN